MIKIRSNTHLSGTAAMAAGIIPTPDAEEYLGKVRPKFNIFGRSATDNKRKKLYMLPLSSISAAASPPSLSGVDRCSS